MKKLIFCNKNHPAAYVAEAGQIIKDEQNGLISHEEIKKIWALRKEAKERTALPKAVNM